MSIRVLLVLPRAELEDLARRFRSGAIRPTKRAEKGPQSARMFGRSSARVTRETLACGVVKTCQMALFRRLIG